MPRARVASEDVRPLRQELAATRRDFHHHPELAFQETRTAGIIARRLRDLGLTVTEGVGKTGVVGVLKGARRGKTLMLRADIDALPIVERVDTPYRSAAQGVMHACGHDGHAAIGLGAAKLLAQRQRDLAGDVLFAFQPAEETATGAQAMLDDGFMGKPPVDAVLSLHLWSYLPAGKVAVRPGAIFASADDFSIIIKGKGGHGAMPHQTVDPVAIAGHVITALQNVVSRELSPQDPGVVTIGMIEGGTAFNIIPDTVKLRGTFRALSQKTREFLAQRIEDITRGVCLAMRADYEFTCRFCCPPVVNDASMTALVQESAADALKPANVLEAQATMTGDDVAYFLQRAPGCYFLVGAGNPEKGIDKPHHHAEFAIDEASLGVGTQVIAQAALDYLGRG